MARGSDSDNQAVSADEQAVTDLDDLDAMIDGGPVEFELGGVKWAFRQPAPSEMARIRMTLDVARHKAWQSVTHEIEPSDIESIASSARKVGWLTAMRENSTDEDERRGYAEQIEAIIASDPTSAWDGIVNSFAAMERDYRAMELLLVAPDDQLRGEFLASTGMVDEARQHLHRALILANTVPNWTQRQQSTAG